MVAGASHDISDLRLMALRMSDALGHRGPDDWGDVTLFEGGIIERSKNCARGHVISRLERSGADQTAILGHRRLAVIDLSNAGHQPMSTVDGRFWITFNGEIYNYRDLRRELESLGTTFRSNSDTEVLLALYAKEGARCLQRLRGMFAFAVWNVERRELFIARDRFGMKPLYYWRRPGLFVFASELKAILACGHASAEIDNSAWATFLSRGCLVAPKTLYREIEALPPGHWARWSGRELTVERYWTLSQTIAAGQAAAGSAASPVDVADKIRTALVESVTAHRVSDVPLGVFLSGGLDSTAILAAIRQSYSGPLRTFTIAFPGTQWDESHLARQAAAHYGTEHTEVEVSKEDFCQHLDDIFLAMDQPTVDGYNTYFVAKCLRQAGGKVALSGLGGDEFLGGYQSFVDVPRLYQLSRLAERVPWLAQLSARVAGRLPLRRAPKMAQLMRGSPYSLQTVWRDYRALFTDEQVRDLGFVPPLTGDSGRADAGLKNPFWDVARLEVEGFMTPQLIRDADVFTMRHGVELRMPFVDHLFLGSVLGAGKWTRVRGSSFKLALFLTMKGFLPSDQLRGRKKGFLFPLEVWLRECLSDGTPSELSRQVRSYLHKPCYRPYVEGFRRGQLHWSRIWALYVLERFKASAGGM